MLRLRGGHHLRILVLGATGHIGQAIVRRALANGFQVTAAVRHPDPLPLCDLDVRTVRLDSSWSALTGLAEGQDVLVDAAAPYSLGPAVPGSAAWRGVVDTATQHAAIVIHAARANNLRLVFVSSFTTLPRHDTPALAMEAAWRRSVYPYFEAKAVMERGVIAAAREGLPAVIVNPVACMGPWEFREGPSFTRTVLSGYLPAVMDQTLSLIDVRDVALAIELALNRELYGHPIPLAGHNVTLAELASRIAACNGMRAAPIPVDRRWASFAAFWAGASFTTFGLPVPSLWGAIPLTAECYPMPPSPEQIAFGLRLRPLEETLCDAAAFHSGSKRMFSP
jgi:dihydroflavonol-4-reductase